MINDIKKPDIPNGLPSLNNLGGGYNLEDMHNYLTAFFYNLCALFESKDINNNDKNYLYSMVKDAIDRYKEFDRDES